MSHKSFYVYNHQGKAGAFVEALLSHGWTQTKEQTKANIILSDMDITSRGRTLEELSRMGKKVFLYPHGAIPAIFYDFDGYKPSKAVSAHFVPAPGHLEVMRAYGYPAPLEVIGWHLSPVRKFTPRREIRRILFAPIHPNNNGFLSRIDREINSKSFRAARTIAAGEGASLTVRYLGDLRINGLWRAGGVAFIQGKPDLSVGEIERSDLVIAHHTFAYMAVALGVPTLMMGEDEAPRLGDREERLLRARSWDKYRDLMRYPLDILDGDPFDLAVRAAGSDSDILQWRERMIGKPFDPALFVERVRSFL